MGKGLKKNDGSKVERGKRKFACVAILLRAPWVQKIPWRRKWQPTPVSLPGKSRGLRSLVGYIPCGLKESDMT